MSMSKPASISKFFLISFMLCIFSILPAYAVPAFALLTPKLTRSIPVGKFPFGVAFSSNGNYALVANSDSGEVSVISMQTKGTVASVKVGEHPTGVAIAPSLTFAYVCNAASGSVSLINMSTLTRSLNIRTGGSPINVVFTPDSRLAFVTDMHGNEVDVINTVQNAVIKRISVGKSPQGLAVSPDGKTVIVANAGGSSFSIIGVSSLSVIRNIQTGKNPTSVAFSPDSSPVRYLYVASGKENTIYVYNIRENFAAAGKIKTLSDPSSIAITPDGMMLIAANFQNMAATVYNAVHFNRITTIDLPPGPMNVAVSPDGSAALVTVTSASTAAFIRFKNSSNAPLAAYAPPFPSAAAITAPGGMAAAPSAPLVTAPPLTSPALPPAAAAQAGQPGHYAYVPSYAPAPPSNQNYVPQPFGKTATIYTGKSPTAEAITPDGRYLYVINAQGSTLSVIDVAKEEVVETVKIGRYPSAVSISPDGHYCFVVNSGSDTVTIISTGDYY